ncbi:MAG: hypothetical protein EPGJADBJ_05227 [Saprospiraceae bacterium]|nr:hypothetical protein [Saprospiraceae bacterium]
MKNFLRFLGYLLGGFILLVLGLATWVNLSSFPKYEPKSIKVAIPVDSATLAQGRKIVETECVLCHLGEDGKLSGRLFSPSSGPFGEFWSRNITKHPEKGIGTYTDGELAYLLRTGIKRNGDWAGPYMTNPNLSDADLGAVIAYLRSDAPLVQPSESHPPAPKYSFLAKALIKLGVFAPKFYDIQPVATPPVSDKIAFGRYLATARYACFRCHSASFETNDDFTPENSKGYFGGGNPVEDAELKPTLSANLTMSKNHGLGNWTESQFHEAVRAGQRPDGHILSNAMPRFGLLSEEEISSIWAYLQTVPVLENNIVANAAK